MPEITPVLYSAAFIAGFFMFLAPCTLPLVPAYLAIIAGVHNPKEPKARQRLFWHAAAFIAGFTLIFITFGVAVGFLGTALVAIRTTLTYIAGLLIILFGLVLLGILSIPGGQTKSLPLPRMLKPGHPASAFLVGTLFAFGWTPCVGPVLATVLLLASTKATALSGGLLLLVFSLGLAVPFLLTALLYELAVAKIPYLARLARPLNFCGGLFLIILGALLLTGHFGSMVAWGLELLQILGLDAFTSYF